MQLWWLTLHCAAIALFKQTLSGCRWQKPGGIFELALDTSMIQIETIDKLVKSISTAG